MSKLIVYLSAAYIAAHFLAWAARGFAVCR
jgi:hypothetical protein